MSKFVVILIGVVSLNFALSFAMIDDHQKTEVDLSFSEKAVAIESGQPVYKEGTRIWLSNPQKEEIKIHLNETFKKLNISQVDLSQITHLKKGTYTLIVDTAKEEKTFGKRVFTAPISGRICCNACF